MASFRRDTIVMIAAMTQLAGSPRCASPNKMIEKYNEWKVAVQNPADTMKVFSFFYNNPHWPLFDKCVAEAERNIPKSFPRKLILKWFKRYPPKTGQGLLAYCESLMKFDPKIAKKYISQTWILQNLSAKYAVRFRRIFMDVLGPIDDAHRAKRLVKQRKTAQLKELTHIVIPDIAKYICEFLDRAFMSKAFKYSKDDIENIHRRLNIVQSLANQKKNKEAADILSISNKDEEIYESDFFNLRRQIAYAALKDGKPAVAYKVISMCKIYGKSENKAKNEWLLGYISFRFFNKYSEAAKHFESAYNGSKRGIRLSKNAFWLAEVYKSKNDIILSLDWYKKAAKHFNTFYGCIAKYKLIDVLGKSASSLQGISVAKKSELKARFNRRELVRVLLSMSDAKRKAEIKYTTQIYRKLIDDIEDPNEEMLLFDMASLDEELEVIIAEETKKQHYSDISKAYKTLSDKEKNYIKKINPDSCFISLAHSVIRQESRFNPNALSNVGAVGLMQIMPSTANYELKKMFIRIDKNLTLFDRKKNILIGSWILNRLLRKYKGNIVYVVAAYNCGEGNLSKFIKSVRKIQHLPMIDMIELIPLKETRIYVKHVIRNLFTYSKIFDANSCYNCPVITNFR
jgi:soluble lytic murein transglycosylase